MERKLVFDIGLHNGDDTRYYLDIGYRVLGVEANPILADRCKQRFCEEIRQGLVTVVNAGVLKLPGVFTFYRNLVDDGWSSFDPHSGRKEKWEEMDISCVTTRQLMVEHGRPFFMKVDIQGSDIETLESLLPGDCPDYVSLELVPDIAIVDKLIDLGYSAFKFVDGQTFWPTTRIFNHQIGWRVLRRIGCVVPGIRNAIKALPERYRAKSEWNPTDRYSPDHYPFTAYSSGPFGEQAAGSWRTASAARKWFLELVRDYRRAGLEDQLWWDVHARHRSVG